MRYGLGLSDWGQRAVAVSIVIRFPSSMKYLQLKWMFSARKLSYIHRLSLMRHLHATQFEIFLNTLNFFKKFFKRPHYIFRPIWPSSSVNFCLERKLLSLFALTCCSVLAVWHCGCRTAEKRFQASKRLPITLNLEIQIIFLSFNAVFYGLTTT
jgi:hypothetical protein